MTSFSDLIQQGAGSAWLFVPSAILLGALHGLEPGHSKTMMAAFIVAIRGTVTQAVMLGVAATISHTIVVWAIALGGMYLWRGIAPESFEPWLQLASGVAIIAMAAWMFWRARKDQYLAYLARDRHHHDHNHEHVHQQQAEMLMAADGYQDAHERAHADDIRHRFHDRSVTSWQIILFGLTGGLIPCPAAITVLLICLQLKQFTLGAVMVLCFSIGLALTLVSVGAVSALSLRHVSRRFTGLSALARRAPYLSSALIVIVGVYVSAQGIHALMW